MFIRWVNSNPDIPISFDVDVKLGQIFSLLGEYVDARIIYMFSIITRSSLAAVISLASFNIVSPKLQTNLPSCSCKSTTSLSPIHPNTSTLFLLTFSLAMLPPLTGNLCCRSAVLLYSCTSHDTSHLYSLAPGLSSLTST